MSAILETREVTKAFGAVRAVEGVSFALAEGEAVGLVGESGSGKSTLLRCLMGLERPDGGTVLHDGADPFADRRSRRRFHRDVRMVFQNPYASLNPRMTVEEIVSEPLLVHEGRGDHRDRVVAVLKTVGLDASHLGRRPAAFSGGQRQRIAIARALVADPRVLVLDEPVSALDVSVQAQVVNLLREMRRELGLTLLFVAHDLAVVRQLCDRVLVMEGGRIVEEGDRDQIYAAPAHPYTRALLAAVPIPDPAADRARRGRHLEDR